MAARANLLPHQRRAHPASDSRSARVPQSAAAKYLNDFALKSTIRRDAAALKDLEPHIGDLWLDQINNDSFNARTATLDRISRSSLATEKSASRAGS